MSTDSSIFRLIDTGNVAMCGRVVQTTNFPDIHLLEITKDVTKFTRKISPSEINPQIYTDNKDDHLYGSVAEQTEAAFRQTILSDCRMQRAYRKFASYSQLKDPGLTTYLIRNGTFATTAGEVLYMYQCRPTIVQARHATRCFEGLPVWANGTNLFLEPITNRLTYQGVIMPCSESFYPKFKTTEGTWIMATPAIMPAGAPAVMKSRHLALNLTVPRFNKIDFASDGIYTAEELRAMRDYMEFPRVREAIAASMGMQADLDPSLSEGFVSAPCSSQ